MMRRLRLTHWGRGIRGGGWNKILTAGIDLGSLVLFTTAWKHSEAFLGWVYSGWRHEQAAWDIGTGLEP